MTKKKIEEVNITLHRIYQQGNNTFGYFVIYDTLFFTVEDTAKIIPANEYYCYLVDKRKSNLSAGLDCVYLIDDNIPDRDALLFMHVANSHKNVDGCIGGGLVIDRHRNIILYSIDAIKLFYGLLSKNHGLNPILLNIVDLMD